MTPLNTRTTAYRVTANTGAFVFSNRVVKQLNASVLTATFPSRPGKSKTGTHKADLYEAQNGSKKLVYHDTCGPVNCRFLGTYYITL